MLSVAVSRVSKSSETVQYLKAKSQYITVFVNMYRIEKITLKIILSLDLSLNDTINMSRQSIKIPENAIRNIYRFINFGPLRILG